MPPSADEFVKKAVGKSIVKGSKDAITIMVVEGPSNRHSTTNKRLGELVISGAQLTKDLIRGTDIDLRIEMSESRDLTVSAFLNGTGQEFSQVFTPKQRTVSTKTLNSEILMLESRIQDEIDEAQESNSRDAADGLKKVLDGVQGLIGTAASLAEDDVTERKFQLEDQKRKLAQQMFELTEEKRLNQVKTEYEEAKRDTAEVVRESGDDREKHMLSEVMAREQTFIHSTSPEKIQAATSELNRLRWNILWRTPAFLKSMFEHLVEKRASMNDQIQASQLIENGRRATQGDDVDGLRRIVDRLWDLMPAAEQESEEMRVLTGII